MSIASIATSEAIIGQAINIRQSEMDVVSLDDMLIRAYSGSTIATGVEKRNISDRMEDLYLVTDPNELSISQDRLSDYNLYVSLVSTLTRKAVGAVETLLRS